MCIERIIKYQKYHIASCILFYFHVMQRCIGIIIFPRVPLNRKVFIMSSVVLKDEDTFTKINSTNDPSKQKTRRKQKIKKIYSSLNEVDLSLFNICSQSKSSR